MIEVGRTWKIGAMGILLLASTIAHGTRPSTQRRLFQGERKTAVFVSYCTNAVATARLVSAHLVRVEGVSKRFWERVALAGVSARFPSGESCVLTGDSGSGKSTLMRLADGEEEL
jgi:ABC-type molybdenum transport system ATPase subunit/photorepair protein PhrA